jgi:hypothetical protein
MKTQTKYIVRHPIYGYFGREHSHMNVLEKSFPNIESARKYKRRADKCHTGHLYNHLGFESLYNEMTEHQSFRFKGTGTIFKLTCSEEVVE